MHMGRLVLGSIAFLFSVGAMAVPVTYGFTGTVDYKDPMVAQYNDDPEMIGNITIDVDDIQTGNSDGKFWFEYQVSMAGQKFFGSWGYLGSTRFSGGSFNIFDEVPRYSFGPYGPDMGELIFNFSGDPFSDGIPTWDWPLDQFTDGTVRFFGGMPSEDGWISFTIRASIDRLFLITPPIIVPEPGTFGLLGVGLTGILLARRRQKK